MKDGFIKVACATPSLRVSDVTYNAEQIVSLTRQANALGVKLLVFPELSLTGYTAGDLFYQEVLLKSAEAGLKAILSATEGLYTLVFVGLPYAFRGHIYNVAAAVYDGKILALIPKTHLPNYNEFYEKRVFTPAPKGVFDCEICGQKTIFSTDVLICSKELPEWKVAAEICEDLWVMDPPSVSHAQAGATILVNLSASNEIVGKAAYRRSLVATQSARLFAAYLYADAGVGESTTDMVFAGHDLIAENGKILAESEPFSTGLTVTEIDVKLLAAERRKYAQDAEPKEDHAGVTISTPLSQTALTRVYPRFPFIPDTDAGERFESILSMQAHALARRLSHVHASSAVIGISGGLDSALALLVAVRAKELLPDEQKTNFTVYGITMPCFGTTNRTYKNAKRLTTALKAKCLKISVKTAVSKHLADIKHDKNAFDVTYENAQARERTQVLMDFANDHNGFVVGTGDLSELALGWATYNGDHMSMYGVNASVPKTLVKHLVAYEAKRYGGVAESTLNDILDTPISPELLPSDGENMTQITEDKVGPYELHDFFLYLFIRYGFTPDKIFRLAKDTFDGVYDEETIMKWLKTFLRRFFAQQFKRSCVPDGVKIGSVSLSPRGDWRMPSDAFSAEWLKTLDE